MAEIQQALARGEQGVTGEQAWVLEANSAWGTALRQTDKPCPDMAGFEFTLLHCLGRIPVLQDVSWGLLEPGPSLPCPLSPAAGTSARAKRRAGCGVQIAVEMLNSWKALACPAEVGPVTSLSKQGLVNYF